MTHVTTISALLHKGAALIDRLTIGRVSLDEQFRVPRGLVGRLVGGIMERQHAPENEWTASLLEAQPCERILEVGFGPGLTIEKLLQLQPSLEITGLDLSRTMVRAAARRNRRAVKEGRVRLRHGDAAVLPFSDGFFDKAVSVHVLYFWTDPERVLNELRRVMKPGGRLVLAFMPREKWASNGEGASCNVYSGEDVVTLLREAGFKNARVIPGDPSRFREVAVIAEK
jgi:ubiquinone/menaquinone biosynthesis C-methylase UbiE